MSKRKLTRRQSWRIEKIQEERKARAQKREDKITRELDSLGPEQPGLVIAHYGAQLDIEPPGKPGEIYRCHLRANLPPLVTGDRIVWKASSKGGMGVVVALEDRDSLLSRPDMRGQLKPVAANIDFIVLVIAPVPGPHPNLIDRYLVAAETVGIEPVILLNKTDLLEDGTCRPSIVKGIDDTLMNYERIGYQILKASTRTEDGLTTLKRLLNEHTSVFVGQSGVGKSSLVNTLLPGVDTKVGPLSEGSGKGTHTTTAARLFHFPAGGMLIDSPGIREFGLWHMEPEDVLHGFREFRPFIGHCKFRDCSHEQEPGCAIRQALLEGDILQQRMDSYRNILNSLEKA